MCDLKRPGAARPQSLNGFAFEIADHILISSWAEAHDLRAMVRLDHGAAVGDDFEEVIAFQAAGSPLYRWILWRNTQGIFVQPVIGKSTRHRSVAAALDSMLPSASVSETHGCSGRLRGSVLASTGVSKSIAFATTLLLLLIVLA